GLLIRRPRGRAAGTANGRPAPPIGVPLTASGDLDRGARFFTGWRVAGGAGPDRPARLVYSASGVAAEARRRLDGLAEVVDAGSRPALAGGLAGLSRRGVHRLLGAGGAGPARPFPTRGAPWGRGARVGPLAR